MNAADIYLLSLVVGQFTPQVTDLINKHIPSANIRFLASLLVAAVISILFNWNRLAFGNVTDFLTSALILWTSGQTAYKFYYDGSSQQQAIRFSTNPLPIKQLIPDVSGLAATIKTAFKKS